MLLSQEIITNQQQLQQLSKQQFFEPFPDIVFYFESKQQKNQQLEELKQIVQQIQIQQKFIQQNVYIFIYDHSSKKLALDFTNVDNVLIMKQSLFEYNEKKQSNYQKISQIANNINIQLNSDLNNYSFDQLSLIYFLSNNKLIQQQFYFIQKNIKHMFRRQLLCKELIQFSFNYFNNLEIKYNNQSLSDLNYKNSNINIIELFQFSNSQFILSQDVQCFKKKIKIQSNHQQFESIDIFEEEE